MMAKAPAFVDSEPADAESGIAPAFLTDAQAAEYLGLTPHQLYLYRRGKKAEGPPFVMHGARVRYPVKGLAQWAASLPQFTTRAEAYAANPKRAKGAARQRAFTAQARKAKVEKRAGQAADAQPHSQ
jgi:hypothetical protein